MLTAKTRSTRTTGLERLPACRAKLRAARRGLPARPARHDRRRRGCHRSDSTAVRLIAERSHCVRRRARGEGATFSATSRVSVGAQSFETYVYEHLQRPPDISVRGCHVPRVVCLVRELDAAVLRWRPRFSAPGRRSIQRSRSVGSRMLTKISHLRGYLSPVFRAIDHHSCADSKSRHGGVSPQRTSCLARGDLTGAHESARTWRANMRAIGIFGQDD
jgi:hypothetical protein